MKRNQRGISLIVLVITIVLMAVLVAMGVVLILSKQDTKTEIEDSEKFFKDMKEIINLTEEEKQNLNYEELVEDIEATKNGKYPVNAEYKESKWVGDGYTITFTGGYDITDYEVYYGDKLICSYTYTSPEAGKDGVDF